MIASLDPRFGGPSVAALGTAVGVRRCGIDNVFLLPSGPAEVAVARDALQLLADEDVPVLTFPLTRIGDVARRWGISCAFARWILAHRGEFEIIHVHAAWTFTTAMGLLAARLGGAHAVLTTHESLTDFDAKKSALPKRLLKRGLRALFLSLFDLVITSSPLARRDSDHELGRKTVVIPHAVRPLPPSERSVLRDRARLHVGYLGRLDPKKNVELVIDALAAVPEAALHIAGDGPPDYREALAERARRRGVADRVTWVGFIAHNEKSGFLASVDVLAMPSAYECFGVAAVEALSVGVPVVISHEVGVADVVQQYRCGLVIEPRVEDIVAALRVLSRDAGLLAAFASNAPGAASAEFSVEVHGQRVVRQYRRLLRDDTRAGRVAVSAPVEERQT